MRLLLASLSVFLAGAGAAIGQSSIYLSNVGALGTQGTVSDGQVAVVAGYYNPGDGGGGSFVWSASSTAQPNRGTVFAKGGESFVDTNKNGRWDSKEPFVDSNNNNTYDPNEAYTDLNGNGRWDDAEPLTDTNSNGTCDLPTGRWLRVDGELSVLMFGARGDGVTDDRPAIQAALNEALRRGTASVHFSGRRYYINGDITTKIEAGAVPNHYPQGLRYVLELGFAVSNATSITLLGEGATLYTDDEKGGYSYPGNDYAPSPFMLLVRTSLKNITVRDLKFDRKVTGGRRSEPGNYMPYEQRDVRPTNSAPPYQLAYRDHPAGTNRGGIMIVPVVGGVQGGEHVNLKNLTFVDCHRAITTSGIPNGEYRDYFGKLEELTVEGCQFIYPYGCNIFVDNYSELPPSENNPNGEFIRFDGGLQATFITNWVKNARFTDCHFDGAVGGSVADSYLRLPVDGFVWGEPEHLICTNNTLRHFGYEGIFQWASGVVSYLGNDNPSFVMPATGSEAVIHSQVSMPASLQPGDRLYIGNYIFTQGAFPLGKFEVVSVTDRIVAGQPTVVRGDLHLKPVADPINVPANTTVNLNGYAIHAPDYAASASAVISNNHIDCSPIAPPFHGGLSGGFGSPGIRVNDAFATITGNVIDNTAGGIIIYESVFADGRMKGSIVSGNVIRLGDTRNPLLSSAFGMEIEADGIIISNNSIEAPYSTGVYGIALKGGDNLVEANTIRTGALDANDTASKGIAVQNFPRNVLLGNTTQNFAVGVGPQNGGGATFVIKDHTSVGDRRNVEIAQGIYEHQVVEFQPTAPGWYRVLEGPNGSNFGTLTLECDESRVNFRYCRAVVQVQYEVAGGFRNLTQQAFSASDSAPVVDGVALLGGRPSLFIKVTKVPVTPIRLVWDTQVAESQLLTRPEIAQNATIQIVPGASTFTITTVDPQDPNNPNDDIPVSHNIPVTTQETGHSLYFFDDPTVVGAGPLENAGLTGDCSIVNVPSTSQLVVRNSNPSATLSGKYKIQIFDAQLWNNHWFAHGPDDKFLFLSEGKVQLGSSILTGSDAVFSGNGSFGSVKTGAGSAAAPGLSFGNDPDGNTGIFSDAVGSIGISLNGEIVARFTSGSGQPNNYGSLLMDFGTDDKPGYGFDGDDDTGIYHAATDTIGFAAGGVPKMTVGTAGVTIGDDTSTGAGTPIKWVKSAVTASLPATSINAGGAMVIARVSVPGASVGDVVSVAVPSFYTVSSTTTLPILVPDNKAKLQYSAFVSEPGVVLVQVYNATSNPWNVTAGVYRIVVFKF